jgi:hypothetical protein
VLITERNLEAQEDNFDIKANTGQESTGVEILLPNVPQCLDESKKVYSRRSN